MNFRYATVMANCSRPMVRFHVLALVFLLAAGFASLMPTQGMASDETVTANATATANVWAAISIEEKSELKFGNITSPTPGTLTTFKLSCDPVDCSGNGAKVMAMGGDGHALGGGPTIGRVGISGEENEVIVIQPGIPVPCLANTDGSGIVAFIKFELTTLTSNNDLVITSDLEVTGPVSAGTYTCSYTVSAYYQSPP